MPRLVPGEIAQVDLQGRVQIPSGVLKSVAWWRSETVRVHAELTYRGLVRVYPTSAVRPLVEDEDGEELSSEAAYVARAARADRYRELSLYGPECRLRLTKEVCPWLGFTLGEPATLYAQAFQFGVEIMTMEHRFGRLSAYTDILPWTFKPPD